MSWRRLVWKFFRYCGYNITRLHCPVGADAFADMKRFHRDDRPVVFDVGANVGQTIDRFRRVFPNSVIHSFEPSPATFGKLETNTRQMRRIQLWNCALGASSGHMTLLENRLTEWSSFLPLSTFGAGSIEKQTAVPMQTVDDVCRQQGIARIDIFKSDTQGYDLEVFKGAKEMLARGAIGMIYCELIFSDMYQHLPSFGALYDFLTDNGFLLVSFYELMYEQNLGSWTASWTDGLFVHSSCSQPLSLREA